VKAQAGGTHEHRHPTNVSKAWNFAHVPRDDGLSYMAYVEQITFLLFLKMADQQTKPPYNRKAIVPSGYDWPSRLAKEETRSRRSIGTSSTILARGRGCRRDLMKAKPEIQNPATLCRLIVDLGSPGVSPGARGREPGGQPQSKSFADRRGRRVRRITEGNTNQR
jgi:hypothetical protein